MNRYNAGTMAKSPTKLDETTITIVGIGLMGGSIACALKKRRFNGTVMGITRNPKRYKDKKVLKVFDFLESPEDAICRSSLVIFCTPVDFIAQGVLEAAPSCHSSTIMTDVGSVKGTICDDLENQLPENAHFIGSHPLAGSEKQGFEHADADLYQDKICIITPNENSPVDQTDRLKKFWEFIGMRVEVMSPQEHDQILARTSHLPHLLASVLTKTVLNEKTLDFAASGFRDSTRIAAGDADLWTSILLDNADAVLSGLEEYCDVLNEFQQTLHSRDAQALKKLLQNAKTTREQLG